MPDRLVDVAKLTPFEAPSIFRGIDPNIEAGLKNYPQTLERLRGVTHFCENLGQQSGPETSGADTTDRRKYMRAALAEYASLDEAAKIDAAAKANVVPTILSLDDPKLHVVRLLRHANIHLAVSKVEQTAREATWRDQDFIFYIYYSPDVGISVQKTNQAHNYHADDLSQMIRWIEAEQMKWGIDHLIRKTAELYVRNLVFVCGT